MPQLTAHRSGKFARYAALIALLASAASAAQAQRLTGLVVEPDARTPAAYVALLVFDTAGQPIARGQTTASGTFVIDLPSAGRFVVRALRVGFRPTIPPPVIVGAVETTLRIQLSGERVVLPLVSVRDRALCASSSSGGEALLNTWDQARAALLGVAGGQPDSTLTVESVAWVVARDVWPDTGTTRAIDPPQRQRGDSFRGRAARDLIRDGFVRTEGDSVAFHAPDAFVLLDPAFAASYCFWLEPGPPEHADWIGLAVRPALAAANKVAIQGVLWLARDGGLVRFDYRYEGLDRVLAAADPGGRVDFLRLPTGQWIVSRWLIRMPQAATELRSEGSLFSAREVPVTRLARVVERGAFVSRVEFEGRQFLELGRQPLALTLQARGTQQPLAGTRVHLPSELREWVVDASSVIQVDRIHPGVHRLLVQTPLMRDVGLPPEPVDVTLYPDTVDMRATLTVPSTTDVRRRLCPGVDQNAAAVGVVPITSARAPGVLQVSRASELDDATRSPRQRFPVVVDSSGRWRACGLPRGSALVLWSEHNGTREVIGRFRIPRTVDLALVGSQRSGTFAVEGTLSPAPTSSEDGARLVVRVLASRDSSPVLDAQAILDDSLLARPNARGELAFPGQDYGTHTLLVRRLGFTPVTRSVALARGATRDETVLLERLPPLLSEVRVRGRTVRVPTKYVDVLRRAASGWGTVFARDEITRAPDLKSVLSRLPGVHVNDRGVIFQRCQGELRMGAGVDPGNPQPPSLSAPKVQIYVDGVRVTSLPASPGEADPITMALRLVNPRDVEFMEVYRGVAQIPAEFLNDACAVIAIWTRAY